jgi:shikimate 5-dehydrogenase
LADALGCSRIDLAGVRVDVLGTGGAARAVLYGLKEPGCTVTLYGRSADRTLRLAEQSGAVAAAWNERLQRDGDVLINCTTVGMWPDVDASPVPADALADCRLVFDLIYNPLETRLLRDAAGTGIKTLNGLDMFVRQAAVQFELWTGSSADLQDARGLIAHEITGQRGMPG